MSACFTFVMGCDALHKSQLNVAHSGRATSDVLSVFQQFSASHDYQVERIERNMTNKSPRLVNVEWVRQETPESVDVAWVAFKKYQPAVMLYTHGDTTTIKLQQLSGPMRPSRHRDFTKELYELLSQKFRSTNIELIE
ncbi:hypothetical protein ACFL9T_22230 [Thermodesulfobacteriota bacterium]